MKSGFIILNKDSGISSHTAVSRVKRLLGVKKAGHTGTLDPLASGVLPILIERGVKASEYMISEMKNYRAIMRFGTATDTEDICGTTVEENSFYPKQDDVLAAVAKFQGEYMQTPPMYSAIKIGGQKLYELAREGKTVERAARKVFIYDISARALNEREYELSVSCSGGTYIRTLITDIAKSLGAIAIMTALNRTEAAGFKEYESVTLADIEKMNDEEKEAIIRPIEDIFINYECIKLPPFFARLAKNGLEIYLRKINYISEVGRRVKLYDENGFFALGEVREYETGLAVKPIKQFEL
jgi:tRNA pseudouridine55 synthase